MNEYQFWHHLRHKKDKTDTEKLLLHMRQMLAGICEILVSESKSHISEKDAIEQIRKTINGINEYEFVINPLKWYEKLLCFIGINTRNVMELFIQSIKKWRYAREKFHDDCDPLNFKCDGRCQGCSDCVFNPYSKFYGKFYKYQKYRKKLDKINKVVDDFLNSEKGKLWAEKLKKELDS